MPQTIPWRIRNTWQLRSERRQKLPNPWGEKLLPQSLLIRRRRVLPQSNLEERSVWVSITPTEVHDEQAASSLQRRREGGHPQAVPARQGPELGPLRGTRPV